MSGPNLSQYFANDPPSMFDEIGANNLGVDKNSSSLLTTMSGIQTDATADFIPYGQKQSDDISVPDHIKDMWEPPFVEPGIPPLLTMPGVQSPNDLNDPIREAVLNLLGDAEANHRKILTADDVTQDERGLRQLIEAGCFRSAVNLTGRCLTIYGQGYGRAGQPAKHTPHSLQLWFTRFALLLKLGQYDLCAGEAEPFGQLNRPDVYFQFYPELHAGRQGSMVSFAFRLLLARLPSFLGAHKTTLDRLTEMVATCDEIKNYYAQDGAASANAVDFWERRHVTVLNALVNCSLSMKNFSLADYLMQKLTNSSSLRPEKRRALYSAWGRIYLQCGDVFGAERKFSEARRIVDTNAAACEARDSIDKGLIAVAQNDFREAFVCFQRAITNDPNNTLLLNNMGVCLLYSGKLKDAIAMFERAITTQRGLSESVLLNLSTLYELESSNDVAKKLELLKRINRHNTDLNINIEYCLKLQTGNKI